MARQWRIKVGIATGLALTLGLILPAALVWLGFDAEALDTAFGQPDWQPIAVYTLSLAALFAASIYASSVSQSSMKAVALTPVLLASLWTVGILTFFAVDETLADGLRNRWVFQDLDRVTDPAFLNRTRPRWLPYMRTFEQGAGIGAMIISMIWIGFVVRSTQLNAQRLRMGWPTVSRQWGRLSGGLGMAGLLLVGLGWKVGYYDQLSSLKSMREDVIQLATQAEQEGKFTPEYLSPLGITNRPSPEALVDALIRQQGFRWLSQNFIEHFQRKPVVGSNPRFLMDPVLARRYGLQTQSTSPGPTTQATNAPSPESASPALQPMMMSRELMLRYGLAPQRQPGTPSPTPSTNPASPESAAPTPAPVPMMSQELMKRYGLLPKGASKTSATMPPKASTNPPANPAPGQ